MLSCKIQRVISRPVPLMAWLAALIIIALNVGFSYQVFTPVPIVDGWPLLHRIMLFEEGQITFPEYLFQLHGAHLHAIIYAIGLLDYDRYGGQQHLQWALSMVAIALTSLFMVRFTLRAARESACSADITVMACMLTALLVASVCDYELLIYPFQAVLTLSRLVYVGLLYLIVYVFVHKKNDDYSTVMILATLSTCFHGIGYVFAVCIIALHILYGQPWRRILWSFMPLLFALIIQNSYNTSSGEVDMMDVALSMQGIKNVLLGVGAFYSMPLRMLAPLIGDRSTMLIGVFVCLYANYKLLTIYTAMPALQKYMPRFLARKEGAAPGISQSEGFACGLLSMAALSAVGAAVFWVVRYHLSGRTDARPFQEFYVQPRYTCYACLVYVLIVIDLLKYNASSVAINRLRYGFLASLLAFCLWSAWYVMQHYRRSEIASSAAAALMSGVPVFQPETDAIWPQSGSDWYWVNELPKTLTYLRTRHKGIWYAMPALDEHIDPAATFRVLGQSYCPTLAENIHV